MLTPYGGCGTDGHPVTTGPHLLVSGLTGTGKTRRVLAPGICAWPGPVVAVSSKPDLFDLTRRACARSGPVRLLDLTGRAPIPDGVQIVRVDPVANVTTADDAVDLAGLLIATGGIGAATNGDGAFWAAAATHPLAALLLAAAHLEEGIGWAMRAVGRPDGDDGTPTWLEAVAVLAAADLGPAQADALAALLAAEDRFRQSVTATMDVALSPWRRESVLASGATPWTPADLARHGGTLHVIAPASGIAAGAAVAVVDQLISHWRWNPGLPPLLVTIDEATNTAPLPDLPNLVTESRSLGVSLVVAVQHTGQLRLRWGEAGAEVLRASFPATLLLRGARERAILEDAAWAMGETEAWSAPSGTHRIQRMTTPASPAGLLPPDLEHARLITGHDAPHLVTIPDCSLLPHLVC